MPQIETQRIQEKIVRREDVGHFSRPLFRDGILILTPNRLYYKVTDNQESTYSLDFLLDKISKVKIFSLLGFLKNCFIVEVDKTRHFFFNDNKKEWVYAIKNAIKKQETDKKQETEKKQVAEN